jgi:diguanylate cyclase (GGDEF)-like protein/PAS domain S-box-containing protein
MLNTYPKYHEVNQLENKISRLEHLLSAAPLTIYTRSPFNPYAITFVSNSVKELLGYHDDDFLNQPNFWIDNVHPEDLEQMFSNLHRVLVGDSIIHKYRFKTKHGEWKWIRDRAKLITDKTTGKPLEIIGGWTDMSELIHAENALIKSQEKIHHLAHYDSLTHLPNRVLITERIEQSIHFSDRENWNFALLFLDLDDFKIVNDSLGHHYGDELLRQVAARLEGSLREVDTAGRLGGDEFVVILSNTTAHGAENVARKIINTFKEPFNVDGKVLSVQTSIGISIYPENGRDSNMLTRHADIAMYQAKSAGRGQYCFFNFKMNTHLEHRLAMERDLREAIHEKQFLLHYQPQIDLVTRKLIGVEALIRWQHPQRGMISPVDFIPIAEDSGLINPIGEWVLKQACEDIKTWEIAGFSGFKVAVNLSLRQLQAGKLFEKISAILQQTGVDGSRLELELTESVMMENHAATLDFMTQCKDLGIHFSIDDFGTGYSSLSYLTKLPLLDILKIDRSFVQEISKDSDANTIVSAIVNMAKSLRLNVIAEGVETLEQLEYLTGCGCDTVQGFHFSRPLNYDTLTELLKNNQHIKE